MLSTRCATLTSLSVVFVTHLLLAHVPQLLDRNPLPLAAAEGNEAIVNKLIEDIKKISVSRTSSRNTFNKVASSSSSEGKTMSRSSSAALLVVEGQLNRRLGVHYPSLFYIIIKSLSNYDDLMI